jgi:adenylate cyclase class 2
MDSPVESEVKVKCDEVDALAAAHPELGWEVVVPRHFEDNFVFELPGAALERRGSILRLRVANGRATLTYKGLLPESASSELKVREELETGVERPEVLAEIFERLGLRRAFRYQKYRTVYRLELDGGEVLAMRDETPFGGFLEIEGDAARVSAAARRLGIDPKAFVRDSYIGIQAALCRARGVPLQDLVFRDQGPGIGDREETLPTRIPDP